MYIPRNDFIHVLGIAVYYTVYCMLGVNCNATARNKLYRYLVSDANGYAVCRMQHRISNHRHPLIYSAKPVVELRCT